MPVPPLIVLSRHRIALISRAMDPVGSAQSRVAHLDWPAVSKHPLRARTERLGHPSVSFNEDQNAGNHAVPGLPNGLDGCDQHGLARSALADLAGAATQADHSGRRARPPPPKVEGPNATLSPIYPPTSTTPVASRWASSSLAGALAGSAIYMPFCGALARNS